ncbi:non-specific serine,threonine protein kinase [Sarracenia purpurea var. burkii]
MIGQNLFGTDPQEDMALVWIWLSLNFLFTSKNEEADMKLIDFSLSDFVRPGNNHISF